MDWFEELLSDDSCNKLCLQYLRNDVDVTYDCYIKWLDKALSTNKEKTIADETEGGKNMNRKETTNKSNRKSPDFRRFIKKVKFNPPATIVFWTDNTKTVVKCQGEDYDPEKGLAMCISKKMLGDKGNYYEVFKKWLPKEDDSDVVQKVFEHIRPQTFEFKLKPIDINQRLFEVLTGVPGAATIKFDTKEEPEPDKKSLDKEKEESKPHSCQWVPKDE